MAHATPSTEYNAEAGKALLKLAEKPDASVAEVQALLDQGADPNVTEKNYWRWTPLMRAAQNAKDTAVLRVLIEAGADVMQEDGDKRIAVEYAERLDTVDTLLEYNRTAQLDKKCGGQEKPLMEVVPNRVLLSVTLGEETTGAEIRTLLARGANPNVVEGHHWARTALMRAASHVKDPDAVRALVDAGADVMKQDYFGEIALEQARQAGVIDALLQHRGKEQLEKKTRDGGSQLSRAVEKLDVDAVEAMLRHGADPSAEKNAVPPLYLAICTNNNRQGKVHALLDYSPETQVNYVEKKTGRNMAMLVMEQFQGYPDSTNHIVGRMIDAGLDLDHRDNNNRSLLDYIEASGFEKMKTALGKSFKAAGANAIYAKKISERALAPVTVTLRKLKPRDSRR